MAAFGVEAEEIFLELKNCCVVRILAAMYPNVDFHKKEIKEFQYCVIIFCKKKK